VGGRRKLRKGDTLFLQRRLAESEELVLNALVIVDFILYELDVFLALDYFPLPHGYHPIRLCQIYYDLL